VPQQDDVAVRADAPDMRMVCGLHAALATLQNEEQGIESAIFLKGGRGDRFESVVQQARNRSVKIRFLERMAMDRMSAGVPHQGVILWTLPRPQPSWDSLRQQIRDAIDSPEQASAAPLLLVLDGVEDPRNFGAILRSAEAFGVQAVIRAKDRSAPLSAAAEKASSGAAQRIDCVSVINIARTLEELHDLGVTLFGLSAEDSTTPETLTFIDTLPHGPSPLCGPIALIAGGEERGLRRLTRERCDQQLTIPMVTNGVESLNVAVAVSVALYEVVRQRRRVARQSGQHAKLPVEASVVGGEV
jgi:23S rRNA (guanosine2251-2'-O)-methyltransferase